MSQLTVTNLRAGSTPQEVITSGRVLQNIASATITGAASVGGTLSISGTSTLTGNVGVGSASISSVGLDISPSSGLSGSTQSSTRANPEFQSGATTAGYGVQVRPRTAAAAFTMASLYGVGVLDASTGVGSTITTQYGLYVASLTAGSTNYAIYTNDGLVRFGDKVSIGSGAASTYQLNVYSADTADDARIGLKTSTSYTAIIEQSNASTFSITNNLGILRILAAGDIEMPSLPTTNPGGSGKLWNDAGTVKIT